MSRTVACTGRGGAFEAAAVLTLRDMTSDAQTAKLFGTCQTLFGKCQKKKKPIYVFECMAIVQSRLLEINLQ